MTTQEALLSTVARILGRHEVLQENLVGDWAILRDQIRGVYEEAGVEFIGDFSGGYEDAQGYRGEV